MPTIPPQDLFQACRTLFGPDISATPEFIEYLQPSGLRSAFRRRALESHPDRTNFLEADGRDLHEEFVSVRGAYELLYRHLLSNLNPQISTAKESSTVRKRAPSPRRSPASATTGYHARRTASAPHGTGDFYYAGRMPDRRLLFGEFLYYTGTISWRTLIDAVAWQRMQRPRIGRIAIDKGLLTHGQVVAVMALRAGNQRFGEAAVVQGYLRPSEVDSLVQHQQLIQKRLGEYFINRGVLSYQELFRLLGRQAMHNRNAAVRAG